MTKATNKIEIGTTLYVIPVGVNNTRRVRGRLLDEVVVTKVGRKYFYVNDRNTKFDLETLRHESDHHYDEQAYYTKQEIIDLAEKDQLEIKIKSVFTQYGDIGLTLEQLRAIKKIIEG